MHSPIALFPLLILVLSQLSTALPQPKDIQLFPRVPQSDGAKDGCHPADYINSCIGISKAAPDGEAGRATAQVTTACEATCWPALTGASAANWDPQGCSRCLKDGYWTIGLDVILGLPCGQFFSNCGVPS